MARLHLGDAAYVLIHNGLGLHKIRCKLCGPQGRQPQASMLDPTAHILCIWGCTWPSEVFPEECCA